MRIKVAQLAGWAADTHVAAEQLPAWLDQCLTEEPATLFVISELALSPYFPTSTNRSWLGSGLPVDADVLADLGKVAEKHSTHLVVPFAESSGVALYNSTLMLGPEGELIECELVSGPCSGKKRPTYRKAHLSENRNTDPGVHEKYFFRPGDGLAVWRTSLGTIAPLICYDRSFPEAWRVVADAGARIVVVPIATSRPERVEMLERELAVAANHNGVFAVAACKAGVEHIDGKAVTYSGGSVVVDPFGDIISRAPPIEGDIAISANLNLDRLDDWTSRFHYRRDRRPDLYH